MNRRIRLAPCRLLTGRGLAVALTAAAAISCAPRASEPEPTGPASPVVAHFGDHPITVGDVDRRILALPGAERPAPGADLDVWYEEQIRELAIDHALLSYARASELEEDEAFRNARRQTEKQIAVRLCLADLRPDVEELTEAQLRAEYQGEAESFATPERRLVYHLFLRYRDDSSTEPAGRPISREEREARRQEIEGLRDRVLAGESFSRLAREHSDSESRHRDGSLDWMTRGQLPQGFEEVVFSLESGVPSEPVATRDGVQLFYVEQILPERQLSFDEARPTLVARLDAQRREAALEEIESQIDTPEGSLVLDRAAFDQLLDAGDEDSVVLSLGGTVITLGDLRRDVRQALSQQAPHSRATASRETAWQVLEGLRRRELLYHHCRATDRIPPQQLTDRLDRWHERALIDLARQRRLLEVAQRNEEWLRRFHQSEIGSFSQPPRWHVRRLRIPLDDDAPRVMLRLEQAAAADGKIGLDALRAELGGEIEDFGLQDLAGLGRLGPKLPQLVAPVDAGHLSPPYRSESALEIAEVVERRESEPLPFDEVRDRVAAAYLAQYAREVYQELSDEILRDTRLEILPEAVDSLRAAGTVPGEVSVEELEALLGEP